ncbi:lipopolysaccharide biosynthesis protein [Cytophaga hutchinsonii]|uniref:Uncharacterized protein n=1 Tax=Cytophaga hutchinsonii (strain ATCC 33406 / DSM 1761 / CIP 103989 / NBRC 15051 / NCIMB 9469 / D465) TaxID=269798 RepID=A0A6N4SPE6_CYTH3|nr:oligosaccharide flippase family protein [Cytophaga hutchinsonii]ABG58162.1 conserved hypothetical protein [Cytophaga hutchinsonii ATCC 33406]SFY02815.1 Membrane protein involved in the export of O-antigen and teichoic acid [Cytophaga hutchinsonii ATCC 33406]
MRSYLLKIYSNNKVQTVIHFGIGQGILQFLNLLVGFLLLRWLTKENFAQFSIVFGFQSMITTLVDLGISGAIIALVANRVNDKLVVGSYIKAARQYRSFLSLFVVPAIGIAFFYITVKYNWGYHIQFFFFLSLVVTIWSQANFVYYNSVLQMHKRMNESYRPQIVAAFGRLIILAALYFLQYINAACVILVNLATQIWNGFQFKRHTKDNIEEPEVVDAEVKRSLMKYIKPMLPSVIFFSVQSQISLFIISLFGNIDSVADVSALGRLSQIFIFLTTFNGVIITPYIARIDNKSLFIKRYIQITTGAIIIACFMIGVSLFFPKILLFIIGEKYYNLEKEMQLTIITTCIGYLTGVLWTIHSSARWIFVWASPLFIAVTLASQVLSVFIFDLSSTTGVIKMNLIGTVFALMVQLLICYFGFRKLKHNPIITL